MLQFITAIFFLFIAVEGLVGIYVAVRFGSDMVGSDLHFHLAVKWTGRVLAVLGIFYGVLLWKVNAVMGYPVFAYAWLFFKTVLGAIWTILTL